MEDVLFPVPVSADSKEVRSKASGPEVVAGEPEDGIRTYMAGGGLGPEPEVTRVPGGTTDSDSGESGDKSPVLKIEQNTCLNLLIPFDRFME